MLKRWKIVAGCVVVAVFVALPVGQAAGQAQGQAENFKDGAGVFVKSLADRAIETLTVKGMTQEERRSRFRVFLDEDFAVNAIGRWVLGRYWRKATKEQQEEYLKLFENLLVSTYADRFADYKGEQLSVLNTLIKGGKDAIVFTSIKGPESPEPAKVDWRVRMTKAGKYKVIDVMVAGISMGMTQRSEFASVIRKNGGSIDGFLTEMRAQKNIGQVAEKAVREKTAEEKAAQ